MLYRQIEVERGCPGVDEDWYHRSQYYKLVGTAWIKVSLHDEFGTELGSHLLNVRKVGQARFIRLGKTLVIVTYFRIQPHLMEKT